MVPLAYPTTTEAAQEELPGHDALRRIAALCRENGIEPVFVMLPAPISEQEQRNVRSVQAIADELGVPFLNMLDMSGVVNYETDCYDYLGHLNPDGASKVTAWLGQWLQNTYGLEDRRGSAVSAYWDENLALYEAYYEELWADLSLLPSS